MHFSDSSKNDTFLTFFIKMLYFLKIYDIILIYKEFSKKQKDVTNMKLGQIIDKINEYVLGNVKAEVLGLTEEDTRIIYQNFEGVDIDQLDENEYDELVKDTAAKILAK